MTELRESLNGLIKELEFSVNWIAEKRANGEASSSAESLLGLAVFNNWEDIKALLLVGLTPTKWRDPSEVPVMKNRTELDIIVCREREGKRYVFPGLYLKDHQLSFDEEPWEREVTGFYYREDQEEGCPYYKMDDLVSKFVGWQYLPQPPAQSEKET